MHPMKQHHILEDLNTLYHHDNLKSHKGKVVLVYAMKAHRKEQRALTLNLWTTRAPACLVSGTEPLEPYELEAAGHPGQSGWFGGEKNFLNLPQIKPQIIQPVA